MHNLIPGPRTFTVLLSIDAAERSDDSVGAETLESDRGDSPGGIRNYGAELRSLGRWDTGRLSETTD